ncbi:hypothetical protein PYCCODRAFT_1471729 [Trametes coccinea BRFM310]|uniref:Uncharacterized protein n=1 Tax=Trametes coccinea (strain BRFM310) TaxID=1353009 RepID=A0A1Y2IAX0_TRAC3|nr:hypothetical protein PYCCODRAFT_1471729 [Trametes coccinea BRFM310]
MFDFFERWDLSIGIVSLVLLVPTVVHFIRTQLPSRRLRILLDLLSDTDVLFAATIEEGLLKEHENFTYQRHLTALRNRTEAVRARVYAGRGCGDDFSNLLQGLTRRINYLCEKVQEVRMSISTTSMRERERRRIAAARHSSLQATDRQSAPGCRMLDNVWTGLCIFGAGPDPQGEDDYLATPLGVVDTPASAHIDQPSRSVHAAHTLSPPPPPPPPQPKNPLLAIRLCALIYFSLYRVVAKVETTRHSDIPQASGCAASATQSGCTC